MMSPCCGSSLKLAASGSGPCLVLKNKRSVSHARPRPADKHDWTLFEMISFLEGQSWTLVRERQRLSADRVLDLAMALRGGPCEDKRFLTKLCLRTICWRWSTWKSSSKLV